MELGPHRAPVIRGEAGGEEVMRIAARKPKCKEKSTIRQMSDQNIMLFAS